MTELLSPQMEALLAFGTLIFYGSRCVFFINHGFDQIGKQQHQQEVRLILSVVKASCIEITNPFIELHSGQYILKADLK